MRVILVVAFVLFGAAGALAAEDLPTHNSASESAARAPYPIAGATVQDVINLSNIKNEWCAAQQVQRKIRTNTSFVHCVYDGYVDALAAARASNVDLAVQFTAGLLVIADGMDRHKLSPAEADAKRAELNTRLQREFELRVRADREANEAQRAREAAEQAQRNAVQARAEEMERQQQQLQAEAQARRSRSQQCFAAALLQNAPTFGNALGNAYQAQAYCAAGLPPPQPAPLPRSTTTNCMPVAGGVQCTTQ
jgi:hypothetical protein